MRLRLTTIVLALALAVFTVGCSKAYVQPNPDPSAEYEQRVKDWQMHIRDNGWSQNVINDIHQSILELTTYTPDPRGHDVWATVQQIKADNLSGDCEDISTLLYCTFKRLEYPHRVRVLIRRLPQTDHALVLLETPEGIERELETVPGMTNAMWYWFGWKVTAFDEHTREDYPVPSPVVRYWKMALVLLLV